MKYNFDEFYKEFEKVKFQKEFMDYCSEMRENASILNGIPFDENKAQSQINKLIAKYEYDLNCLANIYNNGMIAVKTTTEKTAFQRKNELQYINNQIPIIALFRELSKKALAKLLRNEENNNSI